MKISSENVKKRLDVYVSELLGVTRSHAQSMIENGLIRVNDKLENKNYTFEYKYVEKFGKEDYVYKLNKGEELTKKMNDVYMEFSNWLGSWEM